ncbi:Nucleoside phosphatase [Trema orientale]|uniref:Nucleoside phosphatase n=1 Tax=Trema orientale TaxID=63057 RepID=A0A2P5CFA6_TREOI|nr:Nucleoside phosphatase [Trema orientale]
MEPKSPSKLKFSIMGFTQYKTVIRISTVLLVVVLLLVGAHFVFKPGDGLSVFKGSYYTVVVDCGSTGTRVNVYEWVAADANKRELPILLHSYPDNLTNTSLVTTSCKYHCMQTEPGLDKFVGNSSGVRASLEPLITWAEQIIPFERHRFTPIFVLATAGLRRLAIEESRQVLEDVETVIREHSFSYKRSWIRVLTGKEEAYYGWVALSYKMGMFRNHSRSPTLGLLDLGGSSLQVVMEVDGIEEDTHLLKSKFGFTEHRLLAYSLPAFGLNEAFDRTIVLLSQTEALRESAGGKLELRHPCFGADFVQNYTCYGCFGLNVAEQKNISQLKKIGYPSLYLIGVPNWEQCKILARAAATNSSSLDWPSMVGADYKSSLCSKRGSGILNLAAFAHPTTRFHALSGFFAVYDMLNLSPRANLTKVWEKGQHLCSKSWADKSSVSANQYYAAHYCFRVPYMASLIEDSLCLGDREIRFGPADVAWTLGAALVEGEYLWLATPTSRARNLNLYRKVISSPIFVFVLLLCLLFIVYRSQVKLPMLGKKGAAPGASSYSYFYPRRRPN